MALLLSHTLPSPVQQPQDWETLRFPRWQKNVGFDFCPPPPPYVPRPGPTAPFEIRRRWYQNQSEWYQTEQTATVAPLIPGPSQPFDIKPWAKQRQVSDWLTMPFVVALAPSAEIDQPFDIRPWAKQKLPNDWPTAPFEQQFMPSPDAPFGIKFPVRQFQETAWTQINQYGTLAPLSVNFFDVRSRWQRLEVSWTQVNDPNAVNAPLIPGPNPPFEIRPWAKQRVPNDWTTAPFEQAFMPAPDAPFSLSYPRRWSLEIAWYQLEQSATLQPLPNPFDIRANKWQRLESTWTQVEAPDTLPPVPIDWFDIRYPRWQRQEVSWTQHEQTALFFFSVPWFDIRYPQWAKQELSWTQFEAGAVAVAPQTEIDPPFYVARRTFNNLNDWTQVDNPATLVSTQTEIDSPFYVARRVFNNLNDWTQVNDPNRVNAPLIPGPSQPFDIRYPKRQSLEVAWSQIEQSATLQPLPNPFDIRANKWQLQEIAWTQFDQNNTLQPWPVPWWEPKAPKWQRQEAAWTQVEQPSTLAFLSVPWFDQRFPQRQRQEAAWIQVDNPATFISTTIEVDPPFYIRLRTQQNLSDWTQVNDPNAVRAPLIPGPTAPFYIKPRTWQAQEIAWIQIDQSGTLAPVPVLWFDLRRRPIAKSVNWDVLPPVLPGTVRDAPFSLKRWAPKFVNWDQLHRFVTAVAPMTEVDPPWILRRHKYQFVTWDQIESSATVIPTPPVVIRAPVQGTGGSGYGSRTRGYPLAMSRRDFERLISQLPIEEQSQMRIELENTEIEWILLNIEDFDA